MAKATKKSTITLELTEAEVDYICALTQNARIDEEPNEEAQLRNDIFIALASVSETYHV